MACEPSRALANRCQLHGGMLNSTLALLRFASKLNETKWLIMQEASDILKIFDVVTKEMSAEKNVTVSIIRASFDRWLK